MSEVMREFHLCGPPQVFDRLHGLTIARNTSMSDVLRRGVEMLLYMANEELLFGATLVLVRSIGKRSSFSVFRLVMKRPPIHEVRVWCCDASPFPHRLAFPLPEELIQRLEASPLSASYSVSQLVSMGYLFAVFTHIEEERGTRFFLTYNDRNDLEIFPL